MNTAISRASSSPRRHHRRGFSLVELIAVTVILSILAASAIPALARIDALQRSSIASRLAEDLRVARARAMATGLPTFIRFNPTGSATAWSIVRLPSSLHPFSSAVSVIDPTTGIASAGPSAGTTAITLTIERGSHIGFDARGRPIATDTTPVAANPTLLVDQAANVLVTAGTGAIFVTRLN